MNTATAPNPFQNQQPSAQASAVAESDQQRAISETQAAMVIAKKFPRNQIEAMDRILQACTRPSLAENALYSYSRGGTEVTGPSIRLAETAAQCWGNLQFGIRELDQRSGVSTVEAFAWDVETNVREVKIFQVPHIRYTRNGTKQLSDPRDIYEMVANQGARRLRACILGVIPGDVIESAVSQCETTLASNADTSPEAVKKMVGAFAEYGVTTEMIQKRIQCRLEAIRPAQIVQMKKIYASLRDGMSKPADWFEFPDQQAQGGEGKTKTESLKAKVKGKKKPEPEPVIDERQEDLDSIVLSIKSVSDVAALELLKDAIDDHGQAYPDDAPELNAAYQQRIKELKSSSNSSK